MNSAPSADAALLRVQSLPLPSSAKALLWLVQSEGPLALPYAQIAARLGCTRRSVIRAVDLLRSIGLITTEGGERTRVTIAPSGDVDARAMVRCHQLADQGEEGPVPAAREHAWRERMIDYYLARRGTGRGRADWMAAGARYAAARRGPGGWTALEARFAQLCEIAPRLTMVAVQLLVGAVSLHALGDPTYLDADPSGGACVRYSANGRSIEFVYSPSAGWRWLDTVDRGTAADGGRVEGEGVDVASVALRFLRGAATVLRGGWGEG